MYQVLSDHRMSQKLGRNGQVDLGIWREDCYDEIKTGRLVTLDFNSLCFY